MTCTIFAHKWGNAAGYRSNYSNLPLNSFLVEKNASIKLQPNMTNRLFYMVILFTSLESGYSHVIFTLSPAESFPSRVLGLIQQGLPPPFTEEVIRRMSTDQCSENRLLMLLFPGCLSVLALGCLCVFCLCRGEMTPLHTYKKVVASSPIQEHNTTHNCLDSRDTKGRVCRDCWKIAVSQSKVYTLCDKPEDVI